MPTTCFDLRHLETAAARGEAFHRVRDIAPGDCVTLMLNEDPAILMACLGLQTRHRIRWQVEEAEAGTWRVRVRHRDDGDADSLRILLGGDHERLDRLFVQALHHVNAGRTGVAAPLVAAYALGLRRHVHAENEVLASGIPLPRDAARRDPVSVMLDEHARILEQIAFLTAFFADGLPPASEAAPFLALLSASLAKHENREEQNLFPLWDAALRAWRDPDAAGRLMARVKTVLAGGEDGALFPAA